MNCKEIENNIWEYIEGSLDGTLQSEFGKHLEKCPQCAAIEKGMRASMNVIEHSRKTEADPFFFTRLEARMEKQRVIEPKASFVVRYALAASIAFIGIIGGGFLGSFSAEQLNTDFAKNVTIEQADDFGFELADNSFDLIKDFE